MTLADMVQEVFASEGMLARADTHFQPRDGQSISAIPRRPCLESPTPLPVLPL